MKTRPPVFVPTTLKQLERYLGNIDASRAAGFDTEADIQTYKLTGRKPVIMPTTAKVVGASVWGVGLEAMYVPIRHAQGGNIEAAGLAWEALLEWLYGRYQSAASVAATGTAGSVGRTWIHNLGFELQVFRNEGDDRFLDSNRLDDSSVAAWIAGLTQDRNGKKFKKPTLKFLVQHVCGLPARPVFEDVAKGKQASAIPVSEMAEYAAWDAYDTAYLGEYSWKRLVANDLTDHYRNVDMPCVELARSMEAAGYPTDTQPLADMLPGLAVELSDLKAEFCELTETFVRDKVKVRRQVGTYKNGKPHLKNVIEERVVCRGADVAKDHEVSKWLYEDLGWWPKRQSTQGKDGNYTINKEVLTLFEGLSVEGQKAVDLRLRYNLLSKLKGTYIDPISKIPGFYPDGRLHSSFNITGTQTGRWSSQNPNLQNLPSRTKEGKVIRKAIVTPRGRKFIVADLSQAELRYIAHFSKDTNLVKVFTEQGLDLHAITLAGLHASGWQEAQRTDAKIVLFSSMYGITPPRLAAKMRQSEEIAEQALTALWDTYTGIPKLNDWCLRFVEQNGYMKTVLGFKRFLSNRIVKDRRTGQMGLHWSVRNQCLSTLIQGSVADHIKVAGVHIMNELREQDLAERSDLHAQEHDALLVSADIEVLEQVKDIVQRHMVSAIKMRVPMVSDAKVGDSWSDCK